MNLVWCKPSSESHRMWQSCGVWDEGVSGVMEPLAHSLLGERCDRALRHDDFPAFASCDTPT